MHLPLCPHLKEKAKNVRHNLKILPNGLLICKIGIQNPHNQRSLVCNALIDTGAETTLICQTVFSDLQYSKEDAKIAGISTMHADEHVFICNANIKIPYDDWSGPRLETVVVRDISKREEYRVIIGMDILSNYQLVYHGVQKVAWLDEL